MSAEPKQAPDFRNFAYTVESLVGEALQQRAKVRAGKIILWAPNRWAYCTAAIAAVICLCVYGAWNFMGSWLRKEPQIADNRRLDLSSPARKPEPEGNRPESVLPREATAPSPSERVPASQIETAHAPAAPPAASAAIVPPAFGGRRLALVIGNSAYRSGMQLDAPARDARAFADALRQTGFEVEELQDLPLAALKDAIRVFAERAANADWAMIYFSGRGIAIDGANYLVPVDAGFERAAAIEEETLPLDGMLKLMQRPHKFRLVVIDTSRDNLVLSPRSGQNGEARSIRSGLVPVEPPAGVLAAFAIQRGIVAQGSGGDDRSPYTRALIKHLEEPGVGIATFFHKVRETVLVETVGIEPSVYGSLPAMPVYFRPSLAPLSSFSSPPPAHL